MRNKIIMFGLLCMIGLVFASDENMFKLDEAKNFTFILQNYTGSVITSSDCNNSLFYPNQSIIFENLSMTQVDDYYYLEYNNSYWNDETGTYRTRVDCDVSGTVYTWFYDTYVQENYTESWFQRLWGGVEYNVRRVRCWMKLYNDTEYVSNCEEFHTVSNFKENRTLKRIVDEWVLERQVDFYNDSFNEAQSEDYDTDCWDLDGYLDALANKTDYGFINLVYTSAKFGIDTAWCWTKAIFKVLSGVVVNG